MTPKEKFEDIDMSKLPSAATEKLEIVKPYLFDKKYQTDEYKEDRADAAEKMNTLYGLIAQKYPESIKSKAAKAPEPKTPAAMAKQAAQQTVKQPKGKRTKATAGPTKRGNITVLAKEIRKEGESWNDARKRAAAMINAEKKVVVKKANKQYQKLKAYLAKHPIRKGATDLERDAPRKALPVGKRVAKKSGKTYYEYRENRTDRRRSGFPYLRLGGKLHGAGQFAKGGTAKKKSSYAKGGMMDDYTKSFGLVKVKFANPKYNYETNVSGDITEKAAREYFVGKMFDVGVYPKENMQRVIDIEFHPKGTYAKGGMIDLFEDYENIPPNVQEILDKYEDAFMDGDYKGLHEALKEVEKKGYTFEYYLDGQAYGLRPIDVPLNQVKGYEEFAKGGKVGGESKIKDWYIKNYPTDDLGENINDSLTFKGLWAYMGQGYNVYDVLGVGDSIVRERVFEKLAEVYGLEYDAVYKKWLNSSNRFAKGGEINSKEWYSLLKDKNPYSEPTHLRKFTDDEKKQIEKVITAVESKKPYTFDNGSASMVIDIHGYKTTWWIYKYDDYILVKHFYNSRTEDEYWKLDSFKDFIKFLKDKKIYAIKQLYAKGGKIGFEGLSKKVAARYKGKSVPAKYRKEYGKTYDAAEAKEVGNKVAAKVYRQQLAKK